MLRKPLILIAATLSLTVASYAMQEPSAPAGPKTSSTTAVGCLQEVRDFVRKRQTEGPPTAALVSQINREKSAMAMECASRLNRKTIADKDLAALADLYSEAGQTDKAKDAINRALTSKTLAPADRAGILTSAIRAGLKEPTSDERNIRLEKYVDELDRSTAASFDQKLEAHSQMNNWYRYDDVDSGIIKHSTWIIDARKKGTREQRKKTDFAAVSAYVNLAEAWAGQGMNDKALSLLASAKTDLADIPNVARQVDPEIGRLKLVGSPAAAITAPRWLNMPAGKTELPMPGSVTFLEFSAHWCTPCKESYPGVQRLLAKYGPKGFRVVLATQLYGYFEAERNLAPEAEIERDQKYFAEHGMNVPIAIGDTPSSNSANPNNQHYQVGGIPQIHLIDRQGRIRLVMVGYDDANEPKLAKMIEDLLKEN